MTIYQVGATDNILLSSTIGRNKNLVPGEVISGIINGTEELLEDLKTWCGYRPQEERELYAGDLVRTIIVDSTRMKRSEVISNSNIQDGDVIVAYFSTSN